MPPERGQKDYDGLARSLKRRATPHMPHRPMRTVIIYECSSCPVDADSPGDCDVCGRRLSPQEYVVYESAADSNNPED